MVGLLIYLRFVVREGVVPRGGGYASKEAEAGSQAM